MTPEEVLRAATVTPARMMGIEDLVGTVEVGKRADLNVALADPLESISAIWSGRSRTAWHVVRRRGWRTKKSAWAELLTPPTGAQGSGYSCTYAVDSRRTKAVSACGADGSAVDAAALPSVRGWTACRRSMTGGVD